MTAVFVATEDHKSADRIWPAIWVLGYAILVVALPWPINYIVFCIAGCVAGNELHALFAKYWKVDENSMGFSMLSLVIPFSGCAALCRVGVNHGRGVMAYLIAIAFASDTAAYYGGKKFGKYHFAKNISKGKTLEGVVIGVWAAAIVGIIFQMSGWIHTKLFLAVPVSCSLALIGVLGDLSESWLKRKTEVKDSGTLLRGHGGVLDRTDALIPICLMGWLFTAIGLLR